MDFGKVENHPFLKKLIRCVDRGDVLFKQGQMSNTMFIILSGTVRLVAERDGEEHVIAEMDSGQFLGEKAIIQETPYQRLFTAQATSDVVALELSMKEMSAIQKEAPELMMRIIKRSFQISAERLDRANYLTRILRSSDNVQRLFDCIIYLARTTGKRVKEGIRVPLNPDAIYYFIDMERSEIVSYLNRLTKKKLLVKASDTEYFIPDEAALITYLEELKSDQAA